MKKILILTLFGATNYGQVLQNYALQTAIKELGFQVETWNHNMVDNTRLWGNETRSTKNIGKRMIKIVRYALFYRKMLAGINSFQQFRTTYLSLTREMTTQDLPSLNGQYDVFIVGSDQVWNMDYAKADKDTFTLQFVREGKRAAYAASAGSNPKIIPSLAERISTFDYISVREHSLKELLEQSGLTGIRDVCDPVFLLKEDHWKQLLPAFRPSKKPYVFAYFLHANDVSQDLRQLVKSIAKERGLGICHVDRRIGFGTSRYGIGPLEWLSCIAHAEVVVLSSFHGLVFSIIYEKEFFVIHRPSMGDRTRDLLAALGLSERGFDSYEEYCLRKDSIRPIDWHAVKEKLAEIRKNSQDVLRDICNLPENHV